MSHSSPVVHLVSHVRRTLSIMSTMSLLSILPEPNTYNKKQNSYYKIMPIDKSKMPSSEGTSESGELGVLLVDGSHLLLGSRLESHLLDWLKKICISPLAILFVIFARKMTIIYQECSFQIGPGRPQRSKETKLVRRGKT